jgi:hypothetical protein
MAILFVSIKFSQSLMTRINTQSYEWFISLSLDYFCYNSACFSN